MDILLKENTSTSPLWRRLWPPAVIIFSFLACFSVYAFAAPAEKILDFNSHIQVHVDGTMTVTEVIRVVCAGEKIKRGIYRDFPTRYKDGHGKTIRVDFQVVKVLRDNVPETYRTERISRGERVYIGKKDVRLAPAVYTYTLTYRTDRQLGYFKDFDELYWNVTGNNWDFIIERASAVIMLPPGADVLRKAAYTGLRGEQGKNYKFGLDDFGKLTVGTTRALMPGEGLTLAIAWPKGKVRQPGTAEKMSYIFRDYLGVGAALMGFCAVFIYYLIVWLKVGKDPAKGTIIPRFHPPRDLSPTAIRYITRMDYDNKTFAVALINMAVKGALKIIRKDDEEYTLKKITGGTSTLSRLEKRIFQKLFISKHSIRLKKRNRTIIQGTVLKLKSGLKLNFEKIYFFRNKKYFYPGLILTVLTMVALILTAQDMSSAFGMGIWLLFWSLGCGFLAMIVVSLWKTAIGKGKGKFVAVALTLFALPFFGGWVLGVILFSSLIPPPAVIILLMSALLNVLFHHLLKAPTPLGRKVMDEIAGFRQYLAVAEKQRLNALNPPEKTPALFEKFLPYALALDVEQEWGEQFARVLAGTTDSDGYQPAWYVGPIPDDIGFSGLTTDLGQSLVGAVSSASAAPGSSSGSGGGGSSGGGGGGGGGGGW